MTPLFLLRHGPTQASQSGAPCGSLDLPVAHEGQALWPHIKAELLGKGIERVLTSDLQRARLHAEDLGLPCLVLPGLREQSFGDWDGIPWSEIKGADYFFANTVQATPPGGGESFARCASRALMALQGALEGEQTTLVLAHGGSLRAILAHFLGLTLDRALDLSWQPFGLTRLDVYGPNRAVLRFHNRAIS
jgi:broad specificity phosphatase PhoE